jgi:hypothetical protein
MVVEDRLEAFLVAVKPALNPIEKYKSEYCVAVSTDVYTM